MFLKSLGKRRIWRIIGGCLPKGTLYWVQGNSYLLHFVGIKLDINEIKKGGEFDLFEISDCKYFGNIPGSTHVRIQFR